MATAAIGHKGRLILRTTFVVRVAALAFVVLASILLALAVAGTNARSVVPAFRGAERPASTTTPVVVPEPYPAVAS